jgi:LytR cell envelope-related transcriptional attenuator
VDHPLATFDAVRPWRTATLIAVAVAAAELILLVIVGGTLFARHATASTTPRTVDHALRLAPSRHQATAHPLPAAKLSRRQVNVLVLNGNGRPGAASSAATRVKHHGYRVAAVGNSQRMDYTRSIVMYRPGFEAEGRRLGRDLDVAIVGPLDGLRPAQLHGAKAVFIVG